MKKIALHWQIIFGLILGTVYAWASIAFGWNQFTLDYIKPLGDIFLNLLKMIAVPLVLFSIISGVASLSDIRKLGTMGVKTLLAYVLTTMLAVTIGLVLVNAYRPGARVDESLRIENRISYELWRAETGVEVLDDICESCKEENADIVARIRERDDRAADSTLTESEKWAQQNLSKAQDQQESGPLDALVDVVPDNIFKSLAETSMLQVIFFAILFGVVLVTLPTDKVGPIAKLVEGLNDVFVKMVMIVMKAMPVFVFALMAGQIVRAAGADPEKFQELLWFLVHYGVTVLVGLVVIIFIIYPLILTLFVKKVSVGNFLKAMRDVQLTAFTTSSSVATLPVTMDTIHNKLGVSKRVSSFVLPIGATINMDGTSLYQAIAVIALAQFHMVDLTLGQQLIIIITATLASIGAAAIPSAGLVLMILVLQSVGLNPAWIALIFPIDRILDMCRTVANVTGDATVSTLIAASEDELSSKPVVTE